MDRSFETMSMAEILNYVKVTERHLQELQQNLNSVWQRIDILWNEIQKLENDKKKYILEKSNNTDWKNLNLYSGASELSKKYLGYVNLLRNHLTGKGYDLYDKPDNKCARLVFQGDYFINQVFVFYGISKTKVIGKGFIDVYEGEKTHQAKEALQTDEFKNYSDSISALVKKLNIPQDVINKINSEQWKYENGKISPELSGAAQKFFYDVISKLDIYKNSLRHCLEIEFEKNDQIKIKDDERINLKNETVRFEEQIRFEINPDNKNSARNKLKFNFEEFLKRDDCIKCVLNYANNAMSDENKTALETLCSFKYWNPNRKKPNYYKSLLTWCTCDSGFFRLLLDDDKKKVLDTLRSFWDGFLKDQDKDVKNNKQLNGTKLNPDESKKQINNHEDDKNKTESKKDFVDNNSEQLQNEKLNLNQNQNMNNNEDKLGNKKNEVREREIKEVQEKEKIVQNFVDAIFNDGNKKNSAQKQSDPLNVMIHEVDKSTRKKNNIIYKKKGINQNINREKELEIKEKKEKKNQSENDKSGNRDLTNHNSKLLSENSNEININQLPKTKYVLIKWCDNFLRWLQNLWYWITGQNKMWLYTKREGEAENLKLSLLEDKNSIVNLLNERQDKSKKTAVTVKSDENNIKTK